MIEANGGSGAPVTWVLTSGTLPPGVRLEAEGSFSGQPTVPGTFTFSVLAYGGGVANVTFTVSIVAMDGSRFDITRLDVTPVPGGVEPHVLAAIARWESVIVGDLSEDSVPRGLFGSGDCSGFGADLNGASIEDLLILVNVDSIDGPGGTLGQAGPCGRRDDNIPAIGALTLDKDDLDPYVGTQTLTDIVFHEIGHILGFGTIWDGHGCTPGTSGCDYLQDDAGSDPTFTGPNAVLEWRSLGGVGDVPVEATGGPGTALAALARVHLRRRDDDRVRRAHWSDQPTQPGHDRVPRRPQVPGEPRIRGRLRAAAGIVARSRHPRPGRLGGASARSGPDPSAALRRIG